MTSHEVPSDELSAPKVTKWTLTTDPLMVRRMGKTGEECAELLAVTTRIAIQGIDEIDPGTGKTNRERLIEEIGDVYAQLDANVAMLGLDAAFITARRARKLGYMREWESLYGPPAAIKADRERGAEPVAHLIFRAGQMVSPDGGVEADEWLQVAKPGDIGDDKLPAFPVFASPRPAGGGEAVGIERAAQWVQKRLDDYDAEHGSTDPATGTREYPGRGAGDEYVGELSEIVEGIRALAAPVVAPKVLPIEAVNEGLRKDAERYRLLRSRYSGLFCTYGRSGPRVSFRDALDQPEQFSGSMLDAAIDAELSRAAVPGAVL